MSTKAAAIIGKLLRKAETTHSADEADALMAKAQELATRYSIDLAVARHADARAQWRNAPWPSVARDSVTCRRCAVSTP